MTNRFHHTTIAAEEVLPDADGGPGPETSLSPYRP
jgi:hypothetical protein